ncbi:hypothetical protein GCM10010185_47830 [Saccharothrix coeruleofusca]|uniref:Uncharacterized protein n=1 Tax=Saccharothrix coeruleofusca TaxID=33919 RepID=A0A918AQ48_9PSEU|nr:hypothetical protein GCM10010185_47830 [Saccharothrix coeruleofusca]
MAPSLDLLLPPSTPVTCDWFPTLAQIEINAIKDGRITTIRTLEDGGHHG